MQYYLGVLKQYAEFKGRAGRPEFWYFVLINTLIIMVLSFIDRTIGFSDGSSTGLLSGIYQLAVVIPTIAVGVRRMHDSDKSGWWLIAPIVNFIFALMPSTSGKNRFGEPMTISGPASMKKEMPQKK